MSHSSEKFCKGFLLFFGKFLVSKSFMDEKARITFLLLKFLVSQCREISWASPQCFRQIGILKNSMHTRGYHVFPSKHFGLTVPQNFVGIPSIFQKCWGIGNFYALMGYHNFLSKSFVSQCRKLLWASLQCFRNLGYRKILCNMGGITIFRRNFFVSQCWKILGATLQNFKKIEVSKNFMHNRGYHNFPSKKFCLTVPKNFVRESYCFWENFWFQKVLWMKKRVSRFCFQRFWSHSAKNFRGHPLNVSEKLGFWKNLCLLGGITFSHRNFLVSQCRKLLWASLQCFRNFAVSKKFMHNRVYHSFLSKFFFSQCRKNSWASLQSFKNFGVSKSFMLLRVITIFRRKIFCLTVPKNLRASLQCFRKFEVSKKFMHNRGYHNFLSKFFVSLYRKVLWASLESFWKLGVSKSFYA